MSNEARKKNEVEESGGAAYLVDGVHNYAETCKGSSLPKKEVPPKSETCTQNQI